MRFRLVLFAVFGILSIVEISKRIRDREAVSGTPPVEFVEAPPVRGLLRASSFGEGVAARSRLHRTVYVNGPDEVVMEDNDLRGFLDGTYKYAWNQPTQVHVRVGRRPKGDRWGEYEIFRVIQRWTGVRLPKRATVRRAELRIWVERGPADSLRVFLYEVKRDWYPGVGGTLHDNVSPPVPGEVWWNDAAYAESSWALPGVGFASDVDPRADTGAMPLAEAEWSPGEESMTFASDALAECVTRHVGEGRPIGFLLKLSDPLEDLPGSMLIIYSGNEGDTRNSARRPRLTLDWDAPGEIDGWERAILLEHGRAIELPALRTGGGLVAVSFISEENSLAPTLDVRGVGGADTTAWRRFTGVGAVSGEGVAARVIAARDPHVLGRSYHTELRDTWIRTGAPERQRVPWVFTSPSGTRHEGFARYEGEHRWTMEFTPDEIGSWRFHWSQQFDDHPYASPGTTFDVVGGSLANLRAGLGELAAAVRESKKGAPPREVWMTRFARLERAVMLEMTPSIYRSAEGDSARAALNAVREALGGAAVPDSIPMVPDVPPEWAGRTRK